MTQNPHCSQPGHDDNNTRDGVRLGLVAVSANGGQARPRACHGQETSMTVSFELNVVPRATVHRQTRDTPAALPEPPSVLVPVQRIGDRAFVEIGLKIKIRGQVCKLSK